MDTSVATTTLRREDVVTMLDLKNNLSLLKQNPNFRRLWLADIISNFGAWLTYVAVSLVVLHANGSYVDLALVLAAHTLPGVILAPFFGVWVDRWDRKKILFWADILNALLTLLMAYSAYRLHVELLQLALLGRTALGSLAHNANLSVMPSLIPKKDLSAANTLSAATWSMSFATGVACAGVLSSFMNAHDVIILDAVSFLLSALLIGRLPRLAPISAHKRDTPKGEMKCPPKRSLKSFGITPQIARAIFLPGPAAFAAGGAWILLNAVGDQANFLGKAALGIGVFHAFRAIGTGVGPSVLQWMQRRGLSRRRAWNIAIVTVFSSIFGFVLLNVHAVSLIAVLGWGMGGGCLYVLSTTDLQLHSPPDRRGRLTSLWSLTGELGMSMGALLCGYLADKYENPIQATLCVLGIAVLVHLLFTSQGSVPLKGEAVPHARETLGPIMI
jgi:MFS family permease